MADSGQTPSGPADVTWPRTALARLAYSAAAGELADAAIDQVPTVSDSWGRGHEYVEAAARLLGSAELLLARAVVYARERGTAWADIGEALGVSRQSAHERFSGRVQEWERALDEPWAESGRYLSSMLPDGVAEPDRTAEELDRWCAHHVTSGTRSVARGGGVADRMVSAELPRHTAVTEAASVARHSVYLSRRIGDGPPPNAEEIDAHEIRKQAVLRAAETVTGGGDRRAGRPPFGQADEVEG